jgi:hypothetical protein
MWFLNVSKYLIALFIIALKGSTLQLLIASTTTLCFGTINSKKKKKKKKKGFCEKKH